MNDLKFFSDYLLQRYGRRLYRIPFDLALGCPNRTGRFGSGCAFCAEDGGRARHLARNLDLPQQASAGIEFVRTRYGAGSPYIAYFQAFTSTYAPANLLRQLYEKALETADFRVVVIGTRPDALPDPVLELLAELAQKYELWIELGVQSSHDRTLDLIHRGHHFDAVIESSLKLAERGINVACHVIAGLPGETPDDFYQTAERLAGLPFQAVKIHQLLVMRKTPLGSPDFPIRPIPLNEYEYMKLAIGFLRRLPNDWLVMRLMADADPATVVEPHWWMSKGQFLELFKERFSSGEETFPRITTADGSSTLYHPGFRQHFRSLAGAKSESLCKFVEPSLLPRRLDDGSVRLLEIGFGLGTNVKVAMQCCREKRGRLEIISLEQDIRVLEAASRLGGDDSPDLLLISELSSTGSYEKDGILVKLKIGDARKLLPQIEGKFDIIFLDGFSPDCNPELWSYDFLRILVSKLAPTGSLVSYCAAFPFRSALLRCGLQVGESIPFGRRRGGTVASFSASLLPQPLSEKELGIIRNSTAGVCYRDPSLTGTRNELIARRDREVRRLRAYGVPKWFKPE